MPAIALSPGRKNLTSISWNSPSQFRKSQMEIPLTLSKRMMLATKHMALHVLLSAKAAKSQRVLSRLHARAKDRERPKLNFFVAKLN